MYPITVKNWFQHGGHNVEVRFEHMVHDERFWPIVVTLALLALLLGIAIWAGLTGAGGQYRQPGPYYPYTY